MKFLLPLALALGSFTAVAQIPAALTTDPPASTTDPATMGDLAIPSHGAMMNGIIYIAGGAGPHPTVLLLHGFPGGELNLDLAQSIRRAGWNVLVFHYRGAWGSQGAFSFANSIEDTQAVLAWVRDPQNAKKYRIDPERIVLIGHSMGGFMAAATGRDPTVMGVAMLAAWNIGGHARQAQNPEKVKSHIQSVILPLSGCTADGLYGEVQAHKEDWDYNLFIPQLKMHPVLVISADDNFHADNDAFVAAMKSAGATRIASLHLPTDHLFDDHRIALQIAVLDWLNTLNP